MIQTKFRRIIICPKQSCTIETSKEIYVNYGMDEWLLERRKWMILIMYVLNNVYVYVICIYVSFKMFNVFFTEIDIK